MIQGKSYRLFRADGRERAEVLQRAPTCASRARHRSTSARARSSPRSGSSPSRCAGRTAAALAPTRRRRPRGSDREDVEEPRKRGESRRRDRRVRRRLDAPVRDVHRAARQGRALVDRRHSRRRALPRPRLSAGAAKRTTPAIACASSRPARAATRSGGCSRKTIEKVTRDFEALEFNTAISALMVFVRDIEKDGADHARAGRAVRAAARAARAAPGRGAVAAARPRRVAGARAVARGRPGVPGRGRDRALGAGRGQAARPRARARRRRRGDRARRRARRART